MKDLIVLVADKDMQLTIEGLLSRPRSFGISTIEYDVYPHPRRDPGCRNEAHDYLRSFHNQYRHALVMFDWEGCGYENEVALHDLETNIEGKLRQNGWHGDDRVKVIIFNPELEIWVWSDSRTVDRILEWNNQSLPLRKWLRDNNYILLGQLKPADPKKALQDCLQIVRKPRSASIYRQLADEVNFSNCVDAAFLMFKSTLKNWFSV